jgi:anaerobic ribonucleoside-triphosphate reductase activating protein
MQLYLYYFQNSSKVLGLGSRFVIWTQGCDKRCQGCVASNSWDKNSGGFYISIDKLAKEILNANINGITISGGEPFLQSEALSSLIDILNTKKRLNYIVYSGYLYDEIVNCKTKKKLLDKVDLLIDGEYKEELNNNTPLIGSTNQQVYILTDEGKKLALFMQKQKSRDLEFVLKDNEVFLTGIPPKDFDKKIKEIV